MNVEIEINKDSCIKCGRCVTVCPAEIFTQSEARAIPEARKLGTCIVCGHCSAICPTDAINHSEFPPEKVSKTDKSALPSPEQTMLLMKTRRSRRAFKNAPIPENFLSAIIEAANSAPTAKNLQNLEYSLITDTPTLEKIEALTVDVFSNAAKKLSNPIIGFFVKILAPSLYKNLPMLNALKQSFDNGERPILHGAKALLLIHAPQSSMFGCEDANLAYQNASLMAESLNVGQFYTGYVMRAISMDKKESVKKLLGINGKIHSGMALGMPLLDFPNYIDRKRAKIKRT